MSVSPQCSQSPQAERQAPRLKGSPRMYSGFFCSQNRQGGIAGRQGGEWSGSAAGCCLQAALAPQRL